MNDAGEAPRFVKLSQELPQDKWVRVRMEGDFTTARAAVYFDDVLVGETTEGLIATPSEANVAASVGLQSPGGVGESEALYDDVALSLE